MPPTTFCKDALTELASLSPNDGWVRGAYAVCEMYGAADAGRFEIILRRLSLGTGGTALTEGARWLLARWQLASCSTRSEHGESNTCRCLSPARFRLQMTGAGVQVG